MLLMGYPLIQWTAELEDSIVEWISQGKPLREFCRQPRMPSFGAVYDREKLNPEFKERIARAREIGEEVIAQECLTIADDGSNDWMETFNSEGESLGWKLNGEHVQRSKLRVDTRLKLLAKWNPRKYGDRTTLAGDPDNPIQHEIRGMKAVRAELYGDSEKK